MNFKLKNSDVKVSPKIKFLIDEIGAKFKTRFEKLITITDGMRTPIGQANAMYKNFEKEKGTERQRKKYIDKKLFDEIAGVYLTEKKKGRSNCILKMTQVIKQQTARRKFISKHLIESAFDIRTYDLKQSEIDFLVAVISGYKYLSFQNKSKAGRPHIHVQLKKGYLIV